MSTDPFQSPHIPEESSLPWLDFRVHFDDDQYELQVLLGETPIARIRPDQAAASLHEAFRKTPVDWIRSDLRNILFHLQKLEPADASSVFPGAPFTDTQLEILEALNSNPQILSHPNWVIDILHLASQNAKTPFIRKELADITWELRQYAIADREAQLKAQETFEAFEAEMDALVPEQPYFAVLLDRTNLSKDALRTQAAGSCPADLTAALIGRLLAFAAADNAWDEERLLDQILKIFKEAENLDAPRISSQTLTQRLQDENQQPE